MNCNLGNCGGPVQGPVLKLGPVLVLGPQDRSGPDRLQTLRHELVAVDVEPFLSVEPVTEFTVVVPPAVIEVMGAGAIVSV